MLIFNLIKKDPLMSTLNLYETILAFDDQQISSNPQNVLVNWNPKYQYLNVDNPKSEQWTISPGASFTPFSGTVSTSVSSTTQFNVTENPVLLGTYRFTWNGTGTNPVFRNNRNLTLNTIPVTVTNNNNVSATFTVPFASSYNFSGATVGDTLWLPGPTTGDSYTPFNVLNQGAWTIIGVSSNNNSITAVRLPGQPFSAVNETQTVTANSQLDVFSASGVQISNSVNISAGFSSVDFGTYIITNITPTWFEIIPGTNLPLETNIAPGIAGLSFFSFSKIFVRIECSQTAIIQPNGLSSSLIQIQPLDQPYVPGFFELFGPCWSLTVTNTNPGASMKLLVISCE
jgi:hypothetical protein